MKVGLIARADDRGLGILTWEFYRAMRPDRVLVVREPGAESKGFAPHLDRYPDATVVTFDGLLDETTVRDWLAGLDVVYSAETFYDWRVPDWAADAKVATVLHVMPEFYRPELDQFPITALWVPTPWRIETVPAARLVPVPVAADRFTGQLPTQTERLRVLHVAGHRAAADRNGTTALYQALRLSRRPLDVRIWSQDPRVPPGRARARSVNLAVYTGGLANYWDLYADADVLVLPRKYGGLSLPAQEAMAAGLAVVMPDASPNRSWPPVVTVPAVMRGGLQTAAGMIPLAVVDSRVLARTLDEFDADRTLLETAQTASLRWAAEHSWDALRPVYETELARAAEAVHA